MDRKNAGVRDEVCERQVQSLCPICGHIAPAEYAVRDNTVFFDISCPTHGVSSTLASEYINIFDDFMSMSAVTVAPLFALTKGVDWGIADGGDSGSGGAASSEGASSSGDVAVSGGVVDSGGAAGPGSSADSGGVTDPGSSADSGGAAASSEGASGSGDVASPKESADSDSVMSSECPLHCGVCDDHLMTACCVLLDVTQRCDQHCAWCFASAGDGADDEPTLDEIGRWYDRLIELGEERPFNIQISGGEPAVRSDLPEIVALGRAKGFSYIQLNTNGRRLAGGAGADGSGAADDGADVYGGGAVGETFARQLAEAGLSVVYLQFDGMSDSVYEELRGEPLLDIKLRAIENCAKANLPVTLVPTIVKGVNIFENGDGRGKHNDKKTSAQNNSKMAAKKITQDNISDSAEVGEIGKMIDFILANLGTVKGIHFQPASFFGRNPWGAKDRAHSEGSDMSCIREKSHTELHTGRVTMFAVMDEIERQTGGRISRGEMMPITTGHPLCCFCANFLRERNGEITSMATQEQKESGCACCRVPEKDPLEIIRRDRDFVLNKWTATNAGSSNTNPTNCCEGADDGDESSDVMSLDEALSWFRGNMFTISGMAFMDASNLDAERLKRCRVQYFTPDEKLIPFCAYNTIYRNS